MASLPSAWHYRVSAGTGRPGVSILWLDEEDSLICNFYISVAARKIVQIRPWDTLACCWDVKQATSRAGWPNPSQALCLFRSCSHVHIVTPCHSQSAKQTCIIAVRYPFAIMDEIPYVFGILSTPLFVGWFMSQQQANVSLGRICWQLYVLPHWDTSRPYMLSQPVTVYWHRAN